MTITLFLALCACGVLGTSFATTAAGVGVGTFALEAVSTPVFPAHLQLVRGWFTREHTSDGMFALGLASRAAVISSLLLWGGLESFMDWRSVMRLGAAAGIAGAVYARVMHRNVDPRREASFELAPSMSCAVSAKLWRRGDFWLATTATTLIVIVKRGLEFMAPVYFSDTAAALLSDGQASMAATVWSIGLIVSVTVGAAAFRKWPARRVLVADVMMSVSVCGAVALALMPGPVTTVPQLVVQCSLVLVTAFGIGLCMYVPPGMFAVHAGGVHAGVVSVSIDGVAYLSAAVFLRGIKSVINSPSLGWNGVWAIVAVILVAATVAEHFFLRMLLRMSGDAASDTPHHRLPVTSDDGDAAEDDSGGEGVACGGDVLHAASAQADADDTLLPQRRLQPVDDGASTSGVELVVLRSDDAARP